MSHLDPAEWGWGRLVALSGSWIAVCAVLAWWLVARAITHAKQTDTSGGDFIVVLPYGTRHLSILLVVLLLPPAVALIRKLTAG